MVAIIIKHKKKNYLLKKKIDIDHPILVLNLEWIPMTKFTGSMQQKNILPTVGE